jgi:hypothetical protein
VRTKAEAETRLRALPLITYEARNPADQLPEPVVVSDWNADEEREGRGPRRAYRFVNVAGTCTTVTIDTDPSRAQLEALARYLPVAEKDREAVREALGLTAETADTRTR